MAVSRSVPKRCRWWVREHRHRPGNLIRAASAGSCSPTCRVNGSSTRTRRSRRPPTRRGALDVSSSSTTTRSGRSSRWRRCRVLRVTTWTSSGRSQSECTPRNHAPVEQRVGNRGNKTDDSHSTQVKHVDATVHTLPRSSASASIVVLTTFAVRLIAIRRAWVDPSPKDHSALANGEQIFTRQG